MLTWSTVARLVLFVGTIFCTAHQDLLSVCGGQAGGHFSVVVAWGDWNPFVVGKDGRRNSRRMAPDQVSGQGQSGIVWQDVLGFVQTVRVAQLLMCAALLQQEVAWRK